MRRCSFFAALLLCVCFSVPTFAQSTYATVSGTVEDASRALLPGVSVTATNNATGVVSNVVTNESGAYNMTTLLPGTYTVKAELPGFQTKTFTDVELGNAAKVRLNFSLQVAGQSQSVEVTVAADTLLAASSSSIGEVLSQKKVEDLPIVGNNVLSFFTLMPGVRMNDDGVTGTFAGLSADKINVQRDGIDASASARYVQAGAQTATFVNPDLVGEIRIIMAPVDAELGRGNGQVQFLTRSGTNQIRGVEYGMPEIAGWTQITGSTTEQSIPKRVPGNPQSRIGIIHTNSRGMSAVPSSRARLSFLHSSTTFWSALVPFKILSF